MKHENTDELTIFDNNVDKVLEYIEAKGAQSTIDLYRRLLSKLRDYLVEMEIPYTEKAGADWISTLTGYTKNNAAGVIGKLNQVYQGNVITGYYFGSWPKKERLYPVWRQSLESYLGSVAERYASATIKNQRREIQNALLVIQDEYKMCEPSLININQIKFLYNRLLDRDFVSKISKQHTLLSFGYYLKYLNELGMIESYVCMAEELLRHNVTFWLDLPPAIADDIRADQAGGNDISYTLEELINAEEYIVSEMSKTRYSYTALSRYFNHTRVFYCYLKWQKLPLTESAIRIWLDGVKPLISNNMYLEYQRVLYMDIEWVKNHALDFTIHYSDRITKTARLPDWCRPTVEKFLEIKRKEGKASKTVNMYIACCLRFCLYLDEQGLRNFAQLTPQMVKDFNLWDKHETPEGKNAYNCRIRQFLLWLGEEELCPDHLFLAVPTASAHRESIVVVLDETEKEAFDSWMENEDCGTLREKAVLALGRRLGIRGVDVSKLLIENIDWDNATIQIIQQKTQVGLILPMPDDVANALYRYLMFERPESESATVFVTSRAPYKTPDVSFCRSAMDRVFPERNVPGSGFHVFRKTLATEMLQGGATAAETAEQLGQSNTDSLRRYLSLDEERIRTCALLPSKRGIPMEVVF